MTEYKSHKPTSELWSIPGSKEDLYCGCSEALPKQSRQTCGIVFGSACHALAWGHPTGISFLLAQKRTYRSEFGWSQNVQYGTSQLVKPVHLDAPPGKDRKGKGTCSRTDCTLNASKKYSATSLQKNYSNKHLHFNFWLWTLDKRETKKRMEKESASSVIINISLKSSILPSSDGDNTPQDQSWFSIQGPKCDDLKII